MVLDFRPLNQFKVVVVSHKVCWRSPASASGFATDGGFPMQMAAISELFKETKLVVPISHHHREEGILPIRGCCVSVEPLTVPAGAGYRRKLGFPVWFARNAPRIWRSVKAADAVHTPIPGDVGTIGLIFAMLQRKPLFVRHCGNWLVQRTMAERFWRWLIERYAGGRNVMFATGGGSHNPSAKNPNIAWVFATSLRDSDLNTTGAKSLPSDGRIRLISACRQEKGKGTDVVIKSLPEILRRYPEATLDVVGDGSILEDLRILARMLGVDKAITFHGHIRQPQVLDLMKHAHIFCYPTSASEGFPKVVLEALAAGLPTISTEVSVIPQLIGKGCGVLIPGAGETALANAVERICSDPDQYHSMSRKAIEISRTYSLENWRDMIGEALAKSWTVGRAAAEII